MQERPHGAARAAGCAHSLRVQAGARCRLACPPTTPPAPGELRLACFHTKLSSLQATAHLVLQHWRLALVVPGRGRGQVALARTPKPPRGARASESPSRAHFQTRPTAALPDSTSHTVPYIFRCSPLVHSHVAHVHLPAPALLRRAVGAAVRAARLAVALAAQHLHVRHLPANHRHTATNSSLVSCPMPLHSFAAPLHARPGQPAQHARDQRVRTSTPSMGTYCDAQCAFGSKLPCRPTSQLRMRSPASQPSRPGSTAPSHP
jgi:hypothetical protein